jgi:dipeptidyl aminopeptidase/acylaminoacyl peptidase
MTTDPMNHSAAAWHVLLEEIAAPQTPDYLEAATDRASSRRQRPSWTFPGRWLPMTDIIDIAVRPLPAARLPLRTIGAVLVLLALLVAVLAFVGSRSRVPPPFGVARNGLVTWAEEGDIFVGDPKTGIVKRVVASDDLDRNPVFSRDGTHIAFLRQVPVIAGTFDIVVAREDGSGLQVITPAPITTPDQVEWSPDGSFLLVNDSDGNLARYFIDGRAPEELLKGVHIEPEAFRPPNGAQILYERDDDQRALWVMNLDMTRPMQLFGARAVTCACAYSGPARWSPDGSRVAFAVNIDGLQQRIFTVDADGKNANQLVDEPGLWQESDPAWSPDGSSIAFNRWEGSDAGDWPIRAVGLMTSNGTGAVRPLGIAPTDTGAVLEWAPDGRSIFMLPSTVVDTFNWGDTLDGSVARPTILNVDTGAGTQLDWSVGSASSWQRK